MVRAWTVRMTGVAWVGKMEAILTAKLEDKAMKGKMEEALMEAGELAEGLQGTDKWAATVATSF